MHRLFNRTDRLTGGKHLMLVLGMRKMWHRTGRLKDQSAASNNLGTLVHICRLKLNENNKFKRSTLQQLVKVSNHVLVTSNFSRLDGGGLGDALSIGG